MIFRLQVLRFHFVARESIHFDEGQAANAVRGALGTVLRRQACRPECAGVSGCKWAASCPYVRIFEPRTMRAGPSGLRQPARPFVLRAAHLDGQRFEAGGEFHFDLHWFDIEHPAREQLTAAFAELAREGLGKGRRKVELIRADSEALGLDLNPGSKKVSQVRLQFVTPTELKSGNEIAERPEFEILAARIRDRISTLRALYGGRPLELDFRAFSQRAASIEMTRCEIAWVETARRSTRTGQVHPLGGFVGEVEYAGELRGYMPYLAAAQWTGVGRQTSWGKGLVRVSG